MGGKRGHKRKGKQTASQREGKNQKLHTGKHHRLEFRTGGGETKKERERDQVSEKGGELSVAGHSVKRVGENQGEEGTLNRQST